MRGRTTICIDGTVLHIIDLSYLIKIIVLDMGYLLMTVDHRHHRGFQNNTDSSISSCLN